MFASRRRLEVKEVSSPLAIATLLGKTRDKRLFQNTFFFSRTEGDQKNFFSVFIPDPPSLESTNFFSLRGGLRHHPSRSRLFWAKNAANAFSETRFF